MVTNPRIIALVGQTATGKSAAAITIAKFVNGEIVSADSRQVYRGLNLGSGKVSRTEQRRVPHHLIDVADPKRQYTVAHFTRDAQRAISNITQRGHIPLVVGGTGFWVDTLLQGLHVPKVPPNPTLRRSLARVTTAQLYTMLRKRDARRAKTIDRHNRVRLVRALEILTVQPRIPRVTQRMPYRVCWIGIRLSPAQLERNIRQRLQARLRAGMVAEVRRLLAAGVPARRLLALGLEYRFVTQYVQRQLTREAMETKLAIAIPQYAKRQRTWFARNEKISWVRTPAAALRVARAFLRATP